MRTGSVSMMTLLLAMTESYADFVYNMVENSYLAKNVRGTRRVLAERGVMKICLLQSLLLQTLKLNCLHDKLRLQPGQRYG